VSKKPSIPTGGQFMNLRDVAIAHGVTRQTVQDNMVVISTALVALQQGKRIRYLPAPAPPFWGGRIHRVVGVPVDQNENWNVAINRGCPGTPIGGSTVRAVSSLYWSTATGQTCENLVLLNLVGGNYRQAMDWAKQYDLSPASPRHVFALAEIRPFFHREVGINTASVFSAHAQASEDGLLFACGVQFSKGAQPYAFLREGIILGSPYTWLAFVE
jgi:hypothetical protein